MAYESMGKDISEPKEVMDSKRPAKPKLQKPTPVPSEPKPPAISQEMNGSTISEAYEELRKKIGNHWDAKPTINQK